MAAFGDHPPLPESLETILSDETTSTVFLKADCPPRAKRGHISELRLDIIDDNPWTKTEVSDLSSELATVCLLYTSPSPRDGLLSRMPSSA